jgi:hypothetical protein
MGSRGKGFFNRTPEERIAQEEKNRAKALARSEKRAIRYQALLKEEEEKKRKREEEFKSVLDQKRMFDKAMKPEKPPSSILKKD